MWFQHHRFQIWGPHQHPWKHPASEIYYTNESFGGEVSNLNSALNWILAVLYPNVQDAVDTPGDLPAVGNTINDYRVVRDDGDGNIAAYRWEQREGDVSASWYKIYDLDWSSDSILSSLTDFTQDTYVHKYGRMDLDSSGSALTGDDAGQSIYGGTAANSHLTLYANSGDGTGADTGYVQAGDDFRPKVDSALDLGTNTYRWANVYTDSITSGTLTATSGSITDTSGTIDFGDETLTTSDTVTAGTLTIGSGSVSDTSGSISFSDENLSTTGTLSAGDIDGTKLTIDDVVINGTTIEGLAAGEVNVTSYSLDFSGTSQYITIPADFANTGIAGNTGLTVAFWFKRDTTGVEEYLWDIDDSRHFQIYIDSSNKLNLSWRPDSGAAATTFTSGTNVTSGVWYFIAMVCTTTVARYYLDGVVQHQTGAGPWTNFAAINDITYVGCRASDQGQEFDGHIDMIGVWNKELSGAEILALYNSGDPPAYNDTIGSYTSTANLQYYWKLESEAGSTATDTTGTLDAALVGSPSYALDVSTGGSPETEPGITDLNIQVQSGALINILSDATSKSITTTGTIAVTGAITVDNLSLDGNTISSTDTNGDVVIAPNGTGTLDVNADMTMDAFTSTGDSTVTGSLTVDDIGINGNRITSEQTNQDIEFYPNGTASCVYEATVKPATDDTWSLGTSALSWRALYLTLAINDGSGANFTVDDLMTLRNLNASVADGMALFYDSGLGQWRPSLPDTEIDHGTVSGLGDDDHTQYALLAGRSTGQTVIGGTDAGADLTLNSTSNATKGNIFVVDTVAPSVDEAADLGTNSLRFGDLYMSGEGVGFRAQNAANTGALPAASASNVGRLAFVTGDGDLYVDTGGTWRQLTVDHHYEEDAAGWTGSETTVTYDVSSTCTNARRMVWAFKDAGDNYKVLTGAQIDHPTATDVRITFGIAPASGTYVLCGVGN